MTTPIWQDTHSKHRGHKLMIKELGDKIPSIGANEDVYDYADTGTCFGLVEGFEVELGYFDLTELAESTVFGCVPAVERDLYWEPKTIGETRRRSR